MTLIERSSKAIKMLMALQIIGTEEKLILWPYLFLSAQLSGAFSEG
jgi:hypothetical protein